MQYGELMLSAFEQSGEAFFLVLARSFLGRMKNDLSYRGGTEEQINSVLEKYLHATKMIEDLRVKNDALNQALHQ